MNHADKILKLAEIQTTDPVVRDHVNLGVLAELCCIWNKLACT